MASGGAAFNLSHLSLSMDAATMNSGFGIAPIIIPPGGGPPLGNPPVPPGPGNGMLPSAISGSLNGSPAPGGVGPPKGLAPGTPSVVGPPGKPPPAPRSGILTSVSDRRNSPVKELMASRTVKPPNSSMGSSRLTLPIPNSADKPAGFLSQRKQWFK